MNWVLAALGFGVVGFTAYRIVGPMTTGAAPGVAADMTLEGVLKTLGLSIDSTLESAKFVTEVEEGKHLYSYVDSQRKRTIGIGFNMDAAGARTKWQQAGVRTSFDAAYIGSVPITEGECQALFTLTFNQAEASAKQIYAGYAKLGTWQKVALIGMVFQMGAAGVAAFTGTLGALSRGDATGVWYGVMGSLWASQTPARAKRTAMMLAYNKSHRDSENELVAQGLISARERKYTA